MNIVKQNVNIRREYPLAFFSPQSETTYRIKIVGSIHEQLNRVVDDLNFTKGKRIKMTASEVKAYSDGAPMSVVSRWLIPVVVYSVEAWGSETVYPLNRDVMIWNVADFVIQTIEPQMKDLETGLLKVKVNLGHPRFELTVVQDSTSVHFKQLTVEQEKYLAALAAPTQNK